MSNIYSGIVQSQQFKKGSSFILSQQNLSCNQFAQILQDYHSIIIEQRDPTRSNAIPHDYHGTMVEQRDPTRLPWRHG
jgi:hypothetical protein